MKTLVALVSAIVTVSGYLIKVPVAPVSQATLAPSGWIHIQKLMMPLFENICEASDDPMIVRLSQDFIQNTTSAEYWDSDCFTKLQEHRTANTLLAKEEIFTEFNPAHMVELKIVSDVLINAKTFDTFYKTAAWARQNLNCGLYVDAIYLALENRRDTEKLNLPAPYELLPNYFIRKDIIIQGSSLLAGQEITLSEDVRDEGNAYTLDANYTSNIQNNDDESKLAYYREDVGVNSHYFLNMLKYAPWLNKDIDGNSRYGEEMYMWMKQWSSRYNLERLSNGLAEIDGMNWNLMADIPYDPMLVYSNGNDFIHRATQMSVEESEDKALLQTIESNLAIVVTHMRESGYNRTQILNHLMEIIVTGERSYDTLARRLLGKALNNDGNPSVLEHYMTSLRDPMFWKLNKKIVDLIDNALKVLPSYEKNELYFPGVQVVSVDIKKMMTSFEYFEFDITEALKIGNGDTTFHVKIGQQRLSHKPFTVKINLSSLVTQKGLVKIYLGPKIMPGEFSKNKNLFCLMDSFDIDLKKGANIVTRSSENMSRFAPDFMSLGNLRKNIEDALFGLDALPFNSVSSQIQYPSRMTIPKGTPEGLPLQLLVFVAPYMKTTLQGMYSAPSMEFNEAIMSNLYPLDMPIDDNMLLGLPNLMFKDTVISHKSGSSAGSGTFNRQPQPNPYKPSEYNSVNGEIDPVAVIPIHGNEMYEVQNDSPVKLTYNDASKKNNYKPKIPLQQSSFSYKKFDYKNINKEIKTTDVPTEIPLEIPTENPDGFEIIDTPDAVIVNKVDEVDEVKQNAVADDVTPRDIGNIPEKANDSKEAITMFDYMMMDSSEIQALLDRKNRDDKEKIKTL